MRYRRLSLPLLAALLMGLMACRAGVAGPEVSIASVDALAVGDLAPPYPRPVRPDACSSAYMCSQPVEGSQTITYEITGNAEWLSHITGYRNATFSQDVVESSPGRVVLVTKSHFDVDTRARYPLQAGSLPQDIQMYLLPSDYVQSDHPSIVQRATATVGAPELAAEAAARILEWVRSHIAYDYTYSLPNDALSVYENRSGTCGGFSNLAVALLRAAGIPARKESGCAMWVDHGGRHAWVEVYYSDLGWVASEPQMTVNFVDQHVFIGDGMWAGMWCGDEQTTWDLSQNLYNKRYPFGEVVSTYQPGDIWPEIQSADVPAWDRHPAVTSLDQVGARVQGADGPVTVSLRVRSEHCYSSAWELETGATWISASPDAGVGSTDVLVTLDTAGLALGSYRSAVTVTAAPGHWASIEKPLPVTVHVVDEMYRSYLPLVAATW